MKKKGFIGFAVALVAAVLGFGAVRDQENAAFLFSDSESENRISQTADTNGELEVTFLDVGQGDCTLIRTGDSVMMVDAGDNGEGEHVVSYLEEQGIDSLDYLILTHPDADHIGGGDNVLEALEVEQILMPDVANDTVTYQEVMEDIERFSVDVVHPKPGEVYGLGDASFTVLCPEAEAVSSGDMNGASVGIKLVYGENVFVMCGDAEEKAEKAMVERFGSFLECDVLKCGHHGSSTATSASFLEATNPTWAIISCGADNRYGHPHAEVLARLEDDDVLIYRTDLQGTITAVSDGKNISWSFEK